MDDNSKTIAQILKEIDDKTADRSEVLPLLKNIDRNTSRATATAMGVAVEKAMVKATARSEKRQRTSTAGKRQQQASTAIVTSSKKNSSSPGRERSGPVLIHTRDKSGRFVAKAPGASRNIAAEQKQDAQNDKLSSILKDAVMQKKDTIKNTAGKLAFGPFWDIGKELKEAADAMKDNAKDEKSTVGRLKNWGKGTRLGKAAGNAKDRVLAKYQDRKANKTAKAAVPAAASTTVVNNNGGGGGGIVSEIAGNWLGNKLGGSKMGGKLLSKVPMLGKMFPSLAGAGGATAAAAGATGAVAGGAAKVAGGGMLKAVGGRLPLIGGLISGGMTLAAGGSASEAVGSGVGAIGGAALGTMVAGPIGTVVGGIAGEWIGKKLGGVFGKQNNDQEKLMGQEAQQQAGFFSQLPSVLGNAWKAAKDAVQDKVQGAKDAYNESRANGDSVPKAVWSGFKGSVKGASGATKERYQAVKGDIAAASQATGMDQDTLTQIMGMESDFKPGVSAAKNGKKRTTAAGLNQFTDATWKDQLAKHGAKYGLGPGASKFDPRANALMGAEYAKENSKALSRAGFDGNNASNLYMAHFLGAGGTKRGNGAIGFLKKMQQNPDAIPANDPAFAEQAESNASIFKNKDGTGKTYKEIYGGFEARRRRFSIAALEGGQSQPLKNDSSATPAPVAAAQPAKPQQQAAGGGQKASGAGPASSQIVPNEEAENKPVVAKSRGKSSKSNKKKTTGQPATAPATAPAAPAETTAAVEGQTQKATEATQQPVVATGTAVKAGSQVLTAKPDYAAMTQAMFDKDNQPEGAAAATAPPVATATGTVVKKEEPSKFSKEQADSEYATAESEKKAALDAHWSKYRPQIDAMEKSGDISGATKLAKEANAIQGDIYTDYNKKTDATRAKEAAAKDTTVTGTVVKKEEPPQPGQPATATALPPATPATDPSVVTGTATMSPKQYGAGDIFNERKSIDEASKQKKAKMLSDFRSGKTSEADYVKAVAEEDKARNEKKDSLAALTKKAESGQFVSQEEMDKATGKATSQPDKVQALSATQPPLPEVQRLQPAPPPPMEVPAIDKLAKAQEQQAQAQQQNSSKAQDGSGKQGIPNIKTDFDDTMLVLMSYDRT